MYLMYTYLSCEIHSKSLTFFTFSSSILATTSRACTSITIKAERIVRPSFVSFPRTKLTRSLSCNIYNHSVSKLAVLLMIPCMQENIFPHTKFTKLLNCNTCDYSVSKYLHVCKETYGFKCTMLYVEKHAKFSLIVIILKGELLFNHDTKKQCTWMHRIVTDPYCFELLSHMKQSLQRFFYFIVLFSCTCPSIFW